MRGNPGLLVDDEKYREIIPTAILTAYPRTFSDIPYSREIFRQLQRYYGEIDSNLIVDHLAVELEARSKLIDKLLVQTQIPQVLELAAGFSSRGVVFAKLPGTQYVEIDLPEVADLKAKIIEDIMPMPSNLHIIGGNALRKSDFDAACDYYDTAKPLAIVNEGLLRYLTFDEKTRVAKHIKYVLGKFGGVWISGDGGTRSFRSNQDKNIPGVNTTLMNTTKRSNIGNAFESQEHLKEFFENIGFTVEFHDYTEVLNELYSPQQLGISDQEAEDKLLAYASAIVFRLKD